MAEFIPRDVKNSWGIRCTEDVNGDLWLGKVNSVKFKVVFPNIVDTVKSKLQMVRGKRGGVFWINPEEKILTIVTEDSVDSGEYPQCGY